MPYVLKVLWFFPMVMSDKAILQVCNLMFTHQGNRSWELRAI